MTRPVALKRVSGGKKPDAPIEIEVQPIEDGGTLLFDAKEGVQVFLRKRITIEVPYDLIASVPE